ncbi:hypothetical protein GOODEAATRI_010961 [Goodea atripinnis]|uniref:Uncharacterized protein n=1 Tax=Goodea atripinnis TaxID=208336 RepID=A0ABV0NTH5_9TELE
MSILSCPDCVKCYWSSQEHRDIRGLVFEGKKGAGKDSSATTGNSKKGNLSFSLSSAVITNICPGKPQLAPPLMHTVWYPNSIYNNTDKLGSLQIMEITVSVRGAI